MVQNNSSTIIIRRIVVIITGFALILCFVLLILEKTRVTNFYTKPQVPISETPKEGTTDSVNVIVYTPATVAETDEAERIKAIAQERLNSPTSSSGNKIEVSLSAAGQDTKGGPIVVRAIVGTNGGQCKLTIANTSTSQEFAAEVTNLGTYYGCNGFDVPVANFPAGTYQLTLAVTNGASIGSASQQIEVAK